MKKIFLSILLFLLPAIGFSYPKKFNPILPADAVYEKETSKLRTAKTDALRQKLLGKFYKNKTIYHIFTTRLPFNEAKKVLEGKGLVFKPLDKTKKLAELEKQKSKKKKGLVALLKDPDYQAAYGTYQGWLVTLSSYSFANKQKQDRTTIIFTKSVEGKKEEKPSKK